MRRTRGIAAMTLAFAVVLVAVPAHPQDRPPLKEPIALEGTMKAFYRGANVVVVTTMDGVEHVYHFTKNLIVHGGKAPGVDALADLSEGTPVVIHRKGNDEPASADEIDVLGDAGLKITEGRVIHVDRKKKEITLRYGNGKTETLQLTTMAAAENAASIGGSNQAATEFVIYYADEEGHKVVHYVTRKP
jgi:hypothetical protein